MLQQKVNFYPLLVATTPASTSPLTWKRWWLANLFIVILYILMFFYSVWDVHSLRNKKAYLTQQSIALEKKYTQLKASFPPSFFTGNLNQTLDELKKQLLAKQKIIQDIKNQGPFSQVYLALAQVIVPNVWLTNISILKSDTEIVLKGKSLTETAFQDFLSNLAKSLTFSAFSVQVNNIEKASKVSPTENLTFEISMTKK